MATGRLTRLLFLGVALGAARAAPRVVVYAATGGGFGAALAAARTGGNVTLLAQRTHLGGMVTGGLQHTDVGNASIIQGFTREFFTRVEEQYPGRPTSPSYPEQRRGPTGWLFESHVAEKVMEEMLRDAGVTVVRGVGFVVGTRMSASSSRTLEAIQTESGEWFESDVFVDGSYEGDVVARAGASMTWGRESQAQYGEEGAGRQLGILPKGVKLSPYVVPGSPSSGVIPFVSPLVPALPGGADSWMETYTFRTCMTNSPKHRVPLQKPQGYNASEWELFRRLYAVHPPRSLSAAGMNCLGPIPNSYAEDDPACKNGTCLKCDMIGSVTEPGTDMVGGSWAYPNATPAERKAIWAAHANYVLGLMWFWSTDAAVPSGVRAEIQSYGLCDDEYGDITTPMPHWPHQLYIREAKRLVGDWVFTEHEPNATLVSRSVGMGSYSFDCHMVSRIIHRDGDYVVDEGRVHMGSGGVGQQPFEIPYDALLPKRAELSNVLAAVAASSSHIRFNALRMEPTWMIMGQAAGDAAVLAASAGVDVQDVDVPGKLQPLLLQQGQQLHV